MIKIEGAEIESFTFSGGERHVRIKHLPQGTTHVFVFAWLENSEEIMDLLLVCDALRRLGAKHIDLTVPYVPYARQDRVCNVGEPLSVKVMCDLINSIGSDRVTIFDPHSDVTPALINNVNVIEQHKLAPILQSVIVCPDAGAEKKIRKLTNEYVMCRKVRDTVTGEITSTQVNANGVKLLEKKDPFLIVDDICDGGRTFIEIAKALQDYDPRTIDLYVTHGIFSKGMGVFDGLFRNIYWYNKEGRLEKHACYTSDKSSGYYAMCNREYRDQDNRA